MNEPERPTATYGFRDVDSRDKPSLVKSVFDRVADRYDIMNDVMSGGAHRIWKDVALTKLNPQPGEILLDVAGGTGDIAKRFVRRAKETARRRGQPAPAATAFICDYNLEMLNAGRKRGLDERISWTCGDALRLPFPDQRFDAVTISFGLRNVVDIDAALRDMWRVLKPGGRFLCLEFSRVRSGALAALYDAFSFNVIPPLGRLIAGDSEPYQYLVESIRRFPPQEALAEKMRAAGFAKVGFTDLSGGIAAIHMGWRV